MVPGVMLSLATTPSATTWEALSAQGLQDQPHWVAVMSLVLGQVACRDEEAFGEGGRS